MNVIETNLDEVKLIEPDVFHDERGFFFESFNHKKFEECISASVRFVQDNHSYSRRGVLRGLHYQLDPHAQGKLVRVIKGEVFDVAVDIRKTSPTFGKYVAARLSSENNRQLWIPEGFAHGFLTLSETAEVIYKTTNYYSKPFERSICWNDKSIEIVWPECFPLIISDKDRAASTIDSLSVS